MRSPEVVQAVRPVWEAAVAPAHREELTPDGTFYRTLWHEVGHYLGVDASGDGRDLDVALQESASLLEEMKADLASLFVAPALRERGYYTDAQLRALYAAGINRVLQANRPRLDQPYNTMQLMQWNYFLQNGVLDFDRGSQRLRIHYDKYHDAVATLLGRVLDVQYRGDRHAALAFVTEYTTWDAGVHETVARNIRSAQLFRFRLFTYRAIDS
jgi:hypothetical protein